MPAPPVLGTEMSAPPLPDSGTPAPLLFGTGMPAPLLPGTEMPASLLHGTGMPAPPLLGTEMPALPHPSTELLSLPLPCSAKQAPPSASFAVIPGHPVAPGFMRGSASLTLATAAPPSFVPPPKPTAIMQNIRDQIIAGTRSRTPTCSSFSTWLSSTAAPVSTSTTSCLLLRLLPASSGLTGAPTVVAFTRSCIAAPSPPAQPSFAGWLCSLPPSFPLRRYGQNVFVPHPSGKRPSCRQTHRVSQLPSASGC